MCVGTLEEDEGAEESWLVVVKKFPVVKHVLVCLWRVCKGVLSVQCSSIILHLPARSLTFAQRWGKDKLRLLL